VKRNLVLVVILGKILYQVSPDAYLGLLDFATPNKSSTEPIFAAPHQNDATLAPPIIATPWRNPTQNNLKTPLMFAQVTQI
jgi:hypothetical protein